MAHTSKVCIRQRIEGSTKMQEHFWTVAQLMPVGRGTGRAESIPLERERGEALKFTKLGEVAEWLKAHAWKVCIRQRIEGSNPSLSARFFTENFSHIFLL